MFDLALIETIQSYRQPLLDAIMIAFSTLGGDLAYMAAIPLLYWLVSREKAYRLAVVFIWAVWLNVALKEWVGSPRPEMFPQVVALLPAGGPGFPSGHSQASLAFWGWLVVEFRKPWLYLLGTLMILGISFSRLYVGAHFLGDVLGGLVAGLLVILLASLYYRNRTPGTNPRRIWPWLVWLLFPVTPGSEAERVLGFLMGLTASDHIAFRQLPYRERGTFFQHLGRILLGLGGFALFVAFRELTVPGLPRLLWYAAAAAWVTVAAPSLFVALGFSSPERSLVPPRGAGRFLTAMALLLAVAGGSSAYAKSLPRPSLPEDLFADEKGALVIAHRGGAALAPENTIVAFEKGRELGSHWLEMDVWPTADGHIVVIHDDTVDRTTNGQGQVQEMTLHEIQSLDAGYWFTQDGGKTYPFRGLGVFVPTLDEVLTALPDARMVIEIKPDSADFARQVVAKLEEMGAAGRVMLPSFHQAPEDAVRKVSPKIPTSMTFEEGITFQILLRLGLASFWTPPGNVLAQMPPKMHGVPIITEAFIRMAHYKGIPVYAWTIDDATEMRVLNYLGVDAIITDYPDVAIDLRNEGWRRP